MNLRLNSLTTISNAMYEANGLPYHNLIHINQMVADAQNILEHCKTEMSDTLYLAIRYHDVVYDPTRKDNEAKSAALFLRIHEAISPLVFNVPTYDPFHVQALINLTARHLEVLRFGSVLCDEFDARVIMDADLAGFAGPYEIMASNSHNIMLENSHVDVETFTKNRIGFLEAMLKKPQIYYTAFGRREYEEPARANIKRELETLL